MVEDRRRDHRDPDIDEPYIEPSPPRTTAVIFAIVAIALILAIAFFYLTKERASEPADRVTQAAEAADSAARVIGDAAKNAADRLRNDH